LLAAIVKAKAFTIFSMEKWSLASLKIRALVTTGQEVRAELPGVLSIKTPSITRAISWTSFTQITGVLRNKDDSLVLSLFAKEGGLRIAFFFLRSAKKTLLSQMSLVCNKISLSGEYFLLGVIFCVFSAEHLC
jgi:hypothetical protein